jgi:hypothetical protein
MQNNMTNEKEKTYVRCELDDVESLSDVSASDGEEALVMGCKRWEATLDPKRFPSASTKEKTTG